MSLNDNNSQGIEEFGIVTDAQALAARLSGATSSAEAKSIQGQLLGLANIAGGSGIALSEIMKALSSAGSRIVQLKTEEQDATYRRIMASQLLDADTKNLYNGIERFMSEEEKKYLDSIDPEKEYDIATFDENGNVSGSKKVQGYKLQESFILLKANANKGALNPSQLESLNRKLYDNPNGPQGIADVIKGEGRLRDAADILRGHLRTTTNDQFAATERSTAVTEMMGRLLPAAPFEAPAPVRGTFTSMTGALYEVAGANDGMNHEKSDTEKALVAKVSASESILRQLEQPGSKPKSAAELRAAYEAIVDNGDTLLRTAEIVTPEMVAAKTKALPLQPALGNATAKDTAKPAATTQTPARAAEKPVAAAEKPVATTTLPTPALATSTPAINNVLATSAAGSPPLPATQPDAAATASKPAKVSGDAARLEEAQRKALETSQKVQEVYARVEAVSQGKAKGNMAALFAEMVDIIDAAPSDTVGLDLGSMSEPAAVKPPNGTKGTPMPASPLSMAAPLVASNAVDAGTITPATNPAPTAPAAPTGTAPAAPLTGIARGNGTSATR